MLINASAHPSVTIFKTRDQTPMRNIRIKTNANGANDLMAVRICLMNYTRNAKQNATDARITTPSFQVPQVPLSVPLLACFCLFLPQSFYHQRKWR